MGKISSIECIFQLNGTLDASITWIFLFMFIFEHGKLDL